MIMCFYSREKTNQWGVQVEILVAGEIMVFTLKCCVLCSLQSSKCPFDVWLRVRKDKRCWLTLFIQSLQNARIKACLIQTKGWFVFGYFHTICSRTGINIKLQTILLVIYFPNVNSGVKTEHISTITTFRNVHISPRAITGGYVEK